MHLHLEPDPASLSRSVADWMMIYIKETLEKKGRFTIALSGGSTPKQLHHLLAASPYREGIDWQQLHIFWGDERAVPFEDERNNAKMAFDSLLHHVPVPAHQIHVMRTDMEPKMAALEYGKILHQYFDLAPNTFDLVLLGMGDDGHTLSLFPGTEIIYEEDAWVKAFYLSSQSMYRLSLTAPVVNRSSAIAFLVAGQNKAATLKQVLEGEYRPDTYPSQLIRPTGGQLHWFVDQAAASQLTKTQ